MPEITKDQLRDELNAAAEQDSSNGKPKPKPTGACTVTVLDISSCVAPITEASCAEVAKKVGGVYDWVEGGKCPSNSNT